MNLTVKVWRQENAQAQGRFESYELAGCDPRMSVLELLDHLNGVLVAGARPPVAFESDCREGICGACGLMVDSRPHGWRDNLPACHQRIGERDGATITLEPLRSGLYPIVKDLVVDRSVLDEITLAGGFASIATGRAPDADALPVAHDDAELALDWASCIGCGACVAACPNGSAALYAGARIAHLAALPTTSLERGRRARSIATVLDELFGSCTGYGACVDVCPAGLDIGLTGYVARERWGALMHPRRR